MPSVVAIREIASLDHPLVKEVRRALSRGEVLARGEFTGALALDSPHLIQEALLSAIPLEALLFEDDMHTEAMRLVGRTHPPLFRIAHSAFQKMVSTESAQGLLALIRPREWMAHQLFTPSPALTVILAGIQDPGNAGTLLRSAEALGATGALLLRGCVHATAPKVLRAAAGSTFRLPHLAHVQLDQALAMCAANSATVYALDPRADLPLDRVDLRGSCALAIGAEGAGLPPDLLDNAKRVSIPHVRHVESLNAAVAGALALYEAARQRS